MLYKTLILSVLLYGAESWTLSKAAELILGAFERHNRELYELYKDVDVAKIRRLHWLGHIERMDNNAPAKRVFESEPPG